MDAPGPLKVSFRAPLWRPWGSRGRLRVTLGASVRSRNAHVRTGTIFHEKAVTRAPPNGIRRQRRRPLWRLGKTALRLPGRGFRVRKTTFERNGVFAGPSKRDKVTFAFLKERRGHECVHESLEEGGGDFRGSPDTP